MEHSRREFETPKEKLTADAQSLIEKAKAQSERLDIPVDPIIFAQRSDDDIAALRATIAKEQGAVSPLKSEEVDPAGIQPEAIAQNIESPTKSPRILTPEQAAETLHTLAARFNSKDGQALHKGVDWTKVKASLEAKPEALWSINEMEKAGHEPDVYNSDEKGFDIGTCSKESPASGRNCVYDEAAEKWMKVNRPGEKFNGNAVAMAKAMGINLMDPNLYKNVLQNKGKFDMHTWSWLLTQLGIRSTGDALIGCRYDLGVLVRRYYASNLGDGGSWRGSLRVEWAA